MQRAKKNLAIYGCTGLVGLLLAACQKLPPRTPPAPVVEASPSIVKPAAPTARLDNLDEYKVLVARQIVDANPALTFSGRLPPMIPAIVVVNISVDPEGGLEDVAVKRSRDSEASAIALSAVRRVRAPFPKPLHLLHRSHRTLEFSETFLFNDDYHFQLRSLAGPQ